MKKAFMMVLAFCSLTTVSFGQSPADTTSLAQDLKLALSTLDRNRLSTGLLMDEVVTAVSPRDYDGSPQATVGTYEGWQQLYWQYYQAAPNRTTLPTLAGLTQQVGC